MGSASDFAGGNTGRAMHDLPLNGSISDISLPRLIGRLHRERFEGTLRLVIGSTAKVVYFKAGEIASAASNAETDRLANILIQAGRLTQEQLDLAKSRVQEGGSLGKTLIAMGFLTPAELLRGAREQVRQILRSCFLLTSGRFQCDAGPLPREVTVLGLATKRLIFDSLMQSSNRQAIVRQLGSMESVYSPTEELTTGLEALKLEPSMARLAQLLDGTSTLRDLSGHTSLDDFTVSKLFLALEILGMAQPIEPSSETADAAVHGRRIEITPETEPDAPEIVLLEDDQEIGGEPPVPIPESTPASDRFAGTIESTPASDRFAGTIESAPSVAAASPDPPAALATDEALATPVQIEVQAEETPVGSEETPAQAEETLAQMPAPVVEDEGEPIAAPVVATPTPPAGGDAFVEAAADTGEASVPEAPAPARSRTSEPGWQVDPDTGERVAFGPVELTFDGKVSSERKGSVRSARLLGLAAAVIVIVGAVLFFASRRGGDAGDTGSTARIASGTAVPDDERPEPVAPDPAADVPHPGAGEQDTLAAVLSIEAGEETAVAPATIPDAAEPPATSPDASPAPVEIEATSEPPQGSISPFANPSGYVSALRMLDEGEAKRAASLFLDLIAAEDPGRFTMQLMIACQVDTLKSARSSSGDGGSLYFVPFSFKGRDCYRVCWGTYASREEAQAARSTLPSSYEETGITPVIVSLSRLRPPS
jgi:hypothetical protein